MEKYKTQITNRGMAFIEGAVKRHKQFVFSLFHDFTNIHVCKYGQGCMQETAKDLIVPNSWLCAI